MQNRDILTREVASKLGIPHNKVREVVSSQARLAKKAMQKKEPTSVYLRQVGTFVSRQVREKIKAEKEQKRFTRDKEEAGEIDPFIFTKDE